MVRWSGLEETSRNRRIRMDKAVRYNRLMTRIWDGAELRKMGSMVITCHLNGRQDGLDFV